MGSRDNKVIANEIKAQVSQIEVMLADINRFLRSLDG